MILCKKCNSRIEEGLNFCPECGVAAAGGKQSMTPTLVIGTEVTTPCSICSYQIDEGLNFCPGCGVNVKEMKFVPPLAPIPPAHAVSPMPDKEEVGTSFCSSCGEPLSDEIAPCVNCEIKTETINSIVTNTPVTQLHTVPSTNQPVVSFKRFLPIILLSLILIANTIFVPMFSVWGGLFPSGTTHSFIDALDELNRFVGGSYRLWPEIFIWSAFVPAIALLISALAKSKIMAVQSSVAGIGLLLYNLNRYITQVGIDFALNIDNGNIGIGFWIATALFIVCFFYAISIKKQK